MKIGGVNCLKHQKQKMAHLLIIDVLLTSRENLAGTVITVLTRDSVQHTIFLVMQGVSVIHGHQKEDEYDTVGAKEIPLYYGSSLCLS